MRFEPLPLAGAYRITTPCFADERGSFTTTFSARDFAAQGIDPATVQAYIACNRRQGTLRGMHFQKAPHAQAKLVRCVRGAVFDVIIDFRPDSATYTRWCGTALSAANGISLFVPAGFAHGYLTLEDETDVHYQVSAYYAPEAASGVRWDDPAFGIAWPAPVTVINERDRTYPDFRR